MITTAYVQRLARYNRWQNDNLYDGAERLPASERTRETGAFFGSIQGTLSHLMFGDQAWMNRFDPALPPPRAKTGKESPYGYPDWAELRQERAALDQVITGWADGLDAAWLGGDLTYRSYVAQQEYTFPKWVLVTHMFNHQTHHRGQVHCMLTQAGVKPGDTDLQLMPQLIPM